MNRMWVSLRSRISILGDLAAGLYEVIQEDGLSMPPQRVLAEKCRMSEATLSRRLHRWGWEDLVLGLVDARRRTFPVQLWTESWAEWLPADHDGAADARVWACCEQVALGSQTVAAAVSDVWGDQRRLMARLLQPSDTDEGVVDALHALVMGLTARILVDAEFDREDALAVLNIVVKAVAPGSHAA